MAEVGSHSVVLTADTEQFKAALLDAEKTVDRLIEKLERLRHLQNEVFNARDH